MKIQLTSKKQAALLKAASLEPERELEEDILSPASDEDSAEGQPQTDSPAPVDQATVQANVNPK
jgi:hypothetical protein